MRKNKKAALAWWRKLRRDRNKLIKYYKIVFRLELVDENFLRWLPQRNACGYPMYVVRCYTCKGKGEIADIIRNSKYGKQRCVACDGTGKLTGPDYCDDCASLLPHDSVVYHVHVP